MLHHTFEIAPKLATVVVARRSRLPLCQPARVVDLSQEVVVPEVRRKKVNAGDLHVGLLRQEERTEAAHREPNDPNLFVTLGEHWVDDVFSEPHQDRLLRVIAEGGVGEDRVDLLTSCPERVAKSVIEKRVLVIAEAGQEHHDAAGPAWGIGELMDRAHGSRSGKGQTAAEAEHWRS